MLELFQTPDFRAKKGRGRVVVAEVELKSIFIAEIKFVHSYFSITSQFSLFPFTS